MKKRWFVITLIIALICPAATSVQAQAAPGTPFSSDPGFGAQLDPAGQLIPQSLRAAGMLQLDWISINFDWASYWPNATSQPDIGNLDNAMQFAGQNKLAVLLRLSTAPGWAKSAQGPDPELTSWFVANLIKRYPGTLKAVELFPAANTTRGWGGTPNPSAYASLLKPVSTAIKETGIAAILIAPGLVPLPPGPPSDGNMDDLSFLQGLYDAGARDWMPVISICLPTITGDPLKAPATEEHRVLRHYEEVRQVMLANKDNTGVIWITDFHLPSGQIDPNDVSYTRTPSGQAQWLGQAYNQLRSQLYIGVAFLVMINPNAANLPEDPSLVNLIRADRSKHPFYNELKDIILQSNPAKVTLLNFNKPQSKKIVKDRSSPP